MGDIVVNCGDIMLVMGDVQDGRKILNLRTNFVLMTAIDH